MTLGEKLKAARKNLDLTQDDLVQRLQKKGLSINRITLSRWENNRQIPTLNPLQELAEILKISVDYLVKDTVNEHTEKRYRQPESESQKHLHRIVKLYTQLNPTGQDKVCGYAQDLIDTGAYAPKTLQETISAYTIASVAAGIGIDNSQIAPRYRTYGTAELPKHDFCVDVCGDSMFPTICAGETAFCVKNFDKLDGKIYVVSINGEEVIKRCYFEKSKLRLVSDNEQYDDRIISGSDLESTRIIGRVVGWETPLNS